MKALVMAAAAVLLVASLAGCLTQRTVTKNGRTISEGPAIKRPLKEAVENSQWAGPRTQIRIVAPAAVR